MSEVACYRSGTMVRCDECGEEGTGYPDMVEFGPPTPKPFYWPGVNGPPRYSRRYCTDCLIKSFAPMPDPQIPTEAGRNDKEPQEKADAKPEVTGPPWAPYGIEINNPEYVPETDSYRALPVGGVIPKESLGTRPFADLPLNQILRIASTLGSTISLDTNDLGQHTLSIKIVL